ncbi:MAG TPA: NTP transferase domain-containing protein [Thermoanaerobaculia bacterium]|nr:NTP transferase domain-containing protein [Thermoanaerobaculia bacterium]
MGLPSASRIMGLPSASRTIPLIILGGSDLTPAALPPQGRDLHPLSGCKGIDVRLDGRCLIEHLIDRLRESGAFGPVWVAGPAAAYRRAAASIEVIDTDRGFGENIRVGLETVVQSCPQSVVAFTTCDILPEPAELERVLEDYHRGAPCDLWFPLILTDEGEALGASEWKPRYRILPAPGEPAAVVLPGHLAIVDPASLRLSMLYRLFDLGYRTRNRPIRYRRSYMLRHVLWTLLRQDFLHLLALRLPTVTWDCVRSGLAAAAGLRRGAITREELEGHMRRVFVTRSHRLRHPERRVRMPFLRAMSLARDIDTVEEARALGATFG